MKFYAFHTFPLRFPDTSLQYPPNSYRPPPGPRPGQGSRRGPRETHCLTRISSLRRCGMMHRAIVRSLLFVCGLLALVPVDTYGQAATVVSGTVRSSTGTPLVSAVVNVPSLRVGATTDGEGHYQFTLPPAASGQVVINVRRIGYKATTATVNAAGRAITQD